MEQFPAGHSSIRSSRPPRRLLLRLRSGAILCAALLSLAPEVSSARVNLGSLGINTNIGTVIGPGTVDPPGGGGGGGPGSIGDLEALGYTCTPNPIANDVLGAGVVCRACPFEPMSETQSCSVYLCRSGSGQCYAHRQRYNIPRDVITADLQMWAVEFAFGASSYFLGDFNGDGRRDLGARMGAQVRVALSRGTYFEPQPGYWTGPAPVENDAPWAVFDMNHDLIPDVLGVSPDGFLSVGISSGSDIASEVDLTETWCEGVVGNCLIGDVDGDGFPDLVEVMRGAVDTHRTGDVWISRGHGVPGFPPLPPPPAPRDTDGDGVLDRVDNCLTVANPTQADPDGDGFGTACDPDLNNNGLVDQADVNLFVPCFLAVVSQRPACATSDFDGDGRVRLSDLNIQQAALGTPPGPSAGSVSPRIDLVAPADGTILSVGSHKAWVAGYVPDVPVGGVQVKVAGVPVALSGPANLFSTFVTLPAPTPTKLFYPIVIEATRQGRRTVERRVVLVGERALQGQRSHNAFGARLTSAGLDRVEQYVRDHVVPKLVAELPKKINGYRHRPDCKWGGIPLGPLECWDGYEITNATLAAPTVTVELDGTALHVNAVIPSLDFDWTVDGTGWSCGEHATASNLEMDMRYQVLLGGGGRVELAELQEPIVDADFDISGCWGGGHDRIEEGVIEEFTRFLNDPDDYNGHHEPYQKGAVGAAIEGIFANLDMTADVTVQEPVIPTVAIARMVAPGGLGAVSVFDQEPLLVTYDARFEAASQDASGFSFWLGTGIEPTVPVPGLGGPSGAYQIPGFVAPSFPSSLPSGDAFHLAAAVTPNGLNELLEALTHTGLLAQQGFSVDKITADDGTSLRLTAGLLGNFIAAFKFFPPQEQIVARVTPSGVPPVVSGRKGPFNEMVDLHVPQVLIELLDSHQQVAIALRADFRVGVDVTLGNSGNGSISAVARTLKVLDHAILANPIGADPAQVFLRLLCVDRVAGDLCALGDELDEGLNIVLKKIDLPSLADDDPATPDLTLVPHCLQPLVDGTLVATFGLRLPGDLVFAHAGDAIDLACLSSVVTTGTTGPRGTVGTVGTTGVIGTATMTSSPSRQTVVGTAGTLTTTDTKSLPTKLATDTRAAVAR